MAYTYDANGNRISKTVNGVAESYTYDLGDKMLTARAKSYTYDAAGRTVGINAPGGTTTLTYDYESRVTAITGPGINETHTYNGLDTRVGTVQGGVSRTFVRDGSYVTDPVLRDGQATYTPGVSERRGGVSTWSHSGLKNADAQTTSVGAITATRVYDAFGAELSATGTWKGPCGYAGGFGYQEDSSGLKLLGHRYYDPTTGRFLSRDPIKDGRNWYVYCANEPMSRVDPTGLWRRTAGAILGGIAGFILTGGNPVGAAVGAAIGGALGSAADQAEQKGEIDWGQAATDGAVDGATSLIGGAILGKLIKLAMPMQLADDGTVLFVHHTSRKAAEAIAKEGVIRPGGPGLGNLGGNVNGLPRPMLGYARLMGVPAEDTIEVWVPRGNVTQNGLGHLLHKGPIEF